jgi:hypothetical protein
MGKCRLPTPSLRIKHQNTHKRVFYSILPYSTFDSMKKAIFFLLLVLFSTQLVNAQNTLAKIKYEEAEEAFVKEDYRLAITKLEEAETILKATNPKILYLKIMAQAKLIEPNPYGDYALLDKTRKMSTRYLKDYESLSNNEDKYRAVYRVGETLSAYPTNSIDFEKQKQQKAIEKEEANAANASREKEYDDLFMQYVYFKGYKTGLTLEETIKAYPEFKKHYNLKTDSGAVIAPKNGYTSGTLTGFYIRNNKTWGYYGTIQFNTNDDANHTSGAKKLSEVLSTIKATLHFDPVEKNTDISFKDWPGKSTVYTWSKNNKIITLSFMAQSNLGAYYSTVFISSFDGNLGK